jgi:hypothetical protein
MRNFVESGCHVVNVTDPYGRILGFLDRSRYRFFQAAPQLYSRDCVDPVPDALLLRKSGNAGNRTRTFGSVRHCYVIKRLLTVVTGARDNLVVKALCYKSQGRRFETR